MLDIWQLCMSVLLHSCANIIFTGFALWKLRWKTGFFTGCRLSIRRLLVGELAGCCLPVTLDPDLASVSRRWTKRRKLSLTCPSERLVVAHCVTRLTQGELTASAVTASLQDGRGISGMWARCCAFFFCPSWWGVSHSYLDSSGCGSIVNFWPVYRDQ